MLSWLRRECGQELVEYVLVLPVLLVLIFGVAQGSLVILSYNTIGDAARQGARFGLIAEHANNPDVIRTEAYKVTDAAGMKRANLTVTPTVQGDMIRVEIRYNMDLMLWVFGSARITLRAVSTKLIELN